MDIYCLKSGISQSDEERNVHLEELRDSIAPDSETRGDGKADVSAEHCQQLQQVLELLVSGTIESICFRSPDVLASSDDEIARLKTFLSEHDIGLTVDVARIGDGANADEVDEAGS